MPDGKLHKLHTVPQTGYHMIHDMLLTKNYLVFVIPPVRIEMAMLFAGTATVAEALRYFESEPTKILVLRRDGSGEPIVIEQPATMVFHNGNAFEKEGRIVLDTILSPGDGALELLHAHSDDRLPDVPPPRVVRLELDLEKRQLVQRSEGAKEQEFPRFDSRRAGEDARFLYTMESGISDDPLVATHLVRHDLHQQKAERVGGTKGRALGETVFVPRSSGNEDRESDGWLLLQGYDTNRDENFVEVRDAGTLDLAARIWTGHHFPLGFHGNFVPDVFVTA